MFCKIYRQLRGDIILLYKYVNNKYDTDFVLHLQYKFMLVKSYDTRGHRCKLVPQLCKYDLRKHCFANKLFKLWNLPPDDAVSTNFVMLHLAVLVITAYTNLQLVSTSRMHSVMLTYIPPESKPKTDEILMSMC